MGGQNILHHCIRMCDVIIIIIIAFLLFFWANTVETHFNKQFIFNETLRLTI